MNAVILCSKTKLFQVKGAVENQGPGVATETVSMDGFTPFDCRRFCSCQSLKEPQNSTSFQQAARNKFNINHLRTTNFNRVQQDFECGSGPGVLPGSPLGSPLGSTAKIFVLLNSVVL